MSLCVPWCPRTQPGLDLNERCGSLHPSPCCALREGGEAQNRCPTAAVAAPQVPFPTAHSPGAALSPPLCPPGLDFLLPKAGFFCHICSLFYSDESSVRNHCRTALHQQNAEVGGGGWGGAARCRGGLCSAGGG